MLIYTGLDLVNNLSPFNSFVIVKSSWSKRENVRLENCLHFVRKWFSSSIELPLQKLHILDSTIILSSEKKSGFSIVNWLAASAYSLTFLHNRKCSLISGHSDWQRTDSSPGGYIRGWDIEWEGQFHHVSCPEFEKNIQLQMDCTLDTGRLKKMMVMTVPIQCDFTMNQQIFRLTLHCISGRTVTQ